MSKVKLTDAQRRVMKWLGHGWETEPGAGTAIHVNGKRICNVDTMTALERYGFVEQMTLGGRKLAGQWKATSAGKSITEELGL